MTTSSPLSPKELWDLDELIPSKDVPIYFEGHLVQIPPDGLTRKQRKAWREALPPKDREIYEKWHGAYMKALNEDIRLFKSRYIPESTEELIEAHIEKSESEWTGVRSTAKRVESMLKKSGISFTRHDAKGGSVYFDLPSGEKIRVADHPAPIGGGFNTEFQKQMGGAKYDINRKGYRRRTKRDEILPGWKEQTETAIRDELDMLGGESPPTETARWR
jgi:hypothetical protein